MSFVSDIRDNIEDIWDEKSNTILTVATLLGFGASLFLTARGAVKADRKIKELERRKEENDEELTSVEIIKTVAPDCIPTLVAAAFTVACIISNHNINQEEKIALCGAYAMVGKSYEKYRRKVKEIAGDDVAKQIDIAMAEDVRINQIGGFCAYTDALQSLDSAHGECIFFEPISELFFATTPEKMRNAEYHLNRNLALRGDVSLWEFYQFLGIDNYVYNNRRHKRKLKKLGWDCGFLIEEYEHCWIDFEHEYIEQKNDRDMPQGYYVVCATINPRDLSEDYPMEYSERDWIKLKEE